MFKREKRPQDTPIDATGLSWEADIIANLRRDAQRWRLATAGLFAVAMVLAIAVALMLPLRKVVPYVYIVDKLTNEARLITTADETVSSGVLNEKAWAMNFVIARERYSYRILQHDYDQVKRMAGPQVWAVYDKQFEGENALDKRYGDNVEIIPKIGSITLSQGGLATVRYEVATRDYRTTAAPTTARRVATLRFKFEPRVGISEAEAIKNPLGMTIVGYQTDPELADDGAKQ